MSGFTRRQALQLGGLAMASLPLAGARAQGTPATAPRYFLQIVLGGGIDPIYTLDPKHRREVNPEVDVPFAPSAIVETQHGRLGPHLAPLAAIADKLTILKGVAVHTANHQTAYRQITSLRRGYLPRSPSIGEILGTRKREQPLGNVCLGLAVDTAYSSRWLGEGDEGGGIFSHLDAADPAQLPILARVVRDRSKAIAGTTPAQVQTAANLREVADLYERAASVPKFAAQGLNAEEPVNPFDVVLQRAQWLIENDLSSSVQAFLGGIVWDSHYANASRQARFTGLFVPRLMKLVDALARRKGRRGSLLDETLIVISSEIGRFPRLNLAQGKDHYPEIPMLMLGAGVVPGRTFGATGSWMEALPIDTRTGLARTGGHALSLDDVGATVLTAFGVSREAWGYSGRPLDVLLA